MHHQRSNLTINTDFIKKKFIQIVFCRWILKLARMYTIITHKTAIERPLTFIIFFLELYTVHITINHFLLFTNTRVCRLHSL